MSDSDETINSQELDQLIAEECGTVNRPEPKVIIKSMEQLLRETLRDKNVVLHEDEFTMDGKTYLIDFEWTDSVEGTFSEYNSMVAQGSASEGKNNKEIRGSTIRNNPNSLRISKKGQYKARQSTQKNETIDNMFLPSEEDESEAQLSENQMKKAISQLRDTLGKRIHIIFSFSSPISCVIEKKKFPPLNYKKEFGMMVSALKKSKKQILFDKVVMSNDNLTYILTANPYILHLSAHGLQKDKEVVGIFGTIQKIVESQLLIEQSDCTGTLISSESLKTLLKGFDHQIKLVVLLSCQSEIIGKMFFDAGVEHVICIKKELEISDNFCINFSYQFYDMLLNQESTSICKAYEKALNLVNVKMCKDKASDEKHKFLMFHNHEGGECPIFDLNLQEGTLQCEGRQVKLEKMPPKKCNMVGRIHEISQFIQELENCNLIWLEGETEVGKTLLIQEVISALFDRNTFRDGIIYVCIKDSVIYESLLRVFCDTVTQSVIDPEIRATISEHKPEDIFEDFKICIEVLKEMKCLIVFDHCDQILSNDEVGLCNFLEELQKSCEKSKLVFISKAAPFGIQSRGGLEFKLRELKPQDITEFLKQNLSFNLLYQKSREIRDLLANKHRLSTYIDGHPVHLLYLISLLNNGTPLCEIFEQTESIMIKKKCLRTKDCFESLRIDSTLQYLDRLNPNASKALNLLALNPNGISKRDLHNIWGVDWIDLENLLVSRYLIKAQNLNDEKEKIEEIPEYFAFDMDEDEEDMIVAPPLLNTAKSNYQIGLWYTMDSTFAKSVISKMKDREYEEAETDTSKRLLEVLETLVKTPSRQEEILDKEMGNIWAFLTRLKDKAVKNSDYQNGDTAPKNRSEKSQFSKSDGFHRGSTMKYKIPTRKRSSFQNIDKSVAASIFKLFQQKEKSTFYKPNKGKDKEDLLKKLWKTVKTNVTKNIKDKQEAVQVSETNEESKSESNPQSEGQAEIPVKKKIHPVLAMFKSLGKFAALKSKVEKTDETESPKENNEETFTSQLDRGSSTFIGVSELDTPKAEVSEAAKKEVAKPLPTKPLTSLLGPAANVKRTATHSLKSNGSMKSHWFTQADESGNEECSVFDKIVILFSIVLIQAGRAAEAFSVLNEIGLEYLFNRLAFANVYRLVSLWYIKNSTCEDSYKIFYSKKYCNSALSHFRLCKSEKGIALCNLMKIYIKLYYEDHDYDGLSDEAEKKVKDQDLKLWKSIKEIKHFYPIRMLLTKVLRQKKHTNRIDILTKEEKEKLDKLWLTTSIFSTKESQNNELLPRSTRLEIENKPKITIENIDTDSMDFSDENFSEPNSESDCEPDRPLEIQNDSYLKKVEQSQAKDMLEKEDQKIMSQTVKSLAPSNFSMSSKHLKSYASEVPQNLHNYDPIKVMDSLVSQLAEKRINRASREYTSASKNVSLERGNTEKFRYSRPPSMERHKKPQMVKKELYLTSKPLYTTSTSIKPVLVPTTPSNGPYSRIGSLISSSTGVHSVAKSGTYKSKRRTTPTPTNNRVRYKSRPFTSY